MIPKIYLCGPINGCTDDEATTWRSWFMARRSGLGTFIDPMSRDYRGTEGANYREIVDLDKRDIRGCDLVVVMYVKPSVGTSMEVFYAWTLGIPVLIIDESEGSISPWLKYHATSIVRTKEVALLKIIKWLS